MKIHPIGIVLAAVLSCSTEAREKCKSGKAGNRGRKMCAPTRRPRKRTARPVPKLPLPTSPPTTSPPSSAPTTFCSTTQNYNNHLYTAVKGSYTWDQANATALTYTCCGVQGHLAVIGDASENDFIRQNLGGVEGWIGLNDKANEGTFVWITSDPTSYTNWNTDEPNDFGSGEDCVEIYGSDGGWNDLPCDGLYLGTFIIEFDCPA